MRTDLRLSAIATCSLLIIAIGGCGTSGSNPVLFPEARIEVNPALGGTAHFMVDEIVAGSVRHTFPSGTTFTTNGPFLFYLENAPPPYRATFRQAGSGSIEVRLTRIGTGEVTTNVSSGDGTTVTVELRGGVTGPAPTPVTPNLEVRFDVCEPAVGSASCATTADPPGAFDNDFSGTIGDPFLTHLIGRASTSDPRVTTPAVFFLEGAQDNANGVFRGLGQAVLQVQLFVDGELRQTRIGSGDQVVREDL